MKILVNPSIYAHIGVEENILLQQLNYFIHSPKTQGFQHQGKKWIYNTLAQWSAMLKLSEGKVRRAFKTLIKLDIVKAEKLKKSSWWHAKHYTIDYAALQVFFAERGLQLKVGKVLEAVEAEFAPEPPQEMSEVETLVKQATNRTVEPDMIDLLETTNHKQKHPSQKIQQQTDVAVFSEENEEGEGASPARAIQKETGNSELVKLLTEQGVVRPVAQTLVDEFSEEEIQNQVAWLPYRKYDEPGAFLKCAIQNNYSPPREVIEQLQCEEMQKKCKEKEAAKSKAMSIFKAGQKLKTPSGKIAQIRLVMSNAIECIADGISASIPFEKALTWEMV